ncbi:MAG: NifB/NifX family molybdenum-iron cluster-binding protein [Bacteroidales bacterium]|nr:NifB/NifX family molybdenum-iron cluster-binding protein [Bacteroidales bacterium]MBN2699553.1 NifB/NifX family molybdenum-iron cluster-binding protein [Bacteroidales bacterium]
MEKYLIASTGDTLDSKVSGRFGHAGYFLIVDPGTLEYNAIRGVGKDDPQQTGELIRQGISRVIIGNIGPGSYDELLLAGCRIYLCRNMRVNEAVEKVKNGLIPELKEPTLKSSIHSGRKGSSSYEGRGEGRGRGRGMGFGPRNGRGRGGGRGSGMGGGMGRGRYD